MQDGVSTRLTNTFPHKMDPKNRVAIPSEWRAVEGGVLWLLASEKDGEFCLKAYTAKKLESIEREVHEELGMTTKEKNIFLEWMYSRCVEVTINSQGKLCIPKRMCEQVGLSGMVTLVGRGSFFEIWSPAAFEKKEGSRIDVVEGVRDKFGFI